MTEEEIKQTAKNLKLEVEQLLSLWAKTCYYNAIEAPIIYNLYSNNDSTLFVYKDNRKGIYKLMAGGHLKTVNYMPMSYGKNFDCIYSSTKYDLVRMAFTEACKKDLNMEAIDYNVLHKSITDKDKGRMAQRELWPLPELHN